VTHRESEPVSRQDLMRYLDGETSPQERARIERELEASTELRRELAVFRSMKAELVDLHFKVPASGGEVWARVAAGLARPAGWLFLIGGLLVWLVYGLYVFTVSPGAAWRKLVVAGIAIGFLLLLASVIWERYRSWSRDPYRDVRR